MKYYLMVEDYDSLAGSRQSQIVESVYPLKATDEATALREAHEKFAAMPKYGRKAWNGAPIVEYPRRPRLVCDL